MKLKDYEVERNKYIDFYNIKEKLFKNGEKQYSVFNYGIRTGEPINFTYGAFIDYLWSLDNDRKLAFYL